MEPEEELAKKAGLDGKLVLKRPKVPNRMLAKGLKEQTKKKIRPKNSEKGVRYRLWTIVHEWYLTPFYMTKRI